MVGDDLYRRRLAGNIVTVKCRKCSAEIAVDASEPPTSPKNERPQPPAPRPKQAADASVKALSAGTLSIWDTTEEPITLGRMPLPQPGPLPAPKPVPPTKAAPPVAAKGPLPAPRAVPKPPHPTTPKAPPVAKAPIVPAPIIPPPEEEEAPISSSDAPTLTSLTHDALPRKKATANKAASEDFLVTLHAGREGILGAPTIDMSNLATPTHEEVDELFDFEEVPRPAAHKATIPLFDMSQVLPGVQEVVPSSTLSPSNLDLDVDIEPEPITSRPDGKPRERKYVIAPQVRETAKKTAPAAPRRVGGAVWFLLVAAAAGALVIVGVRHQRMPHPAPALEPPDHRQTQPDNDLATPPIEAPVTPLANAPNAPASAEAPSDAPAEARGAAVVKPNQPTTTSTAAAPVQTAAVAPKSVDAPTPPAPVAHQDAPSSTEKPAATEKPAVVTPKVAPTPAPAPAEPGTEFDRAAAVAALRAAAAEASACRKDGDPSGTASLSITFAPSGRVTSANLQGPPFAGTQTGGCIASAMRRAHVPAFSGEYVTVSKTIVIQ